MRPNSVRTKCPTRSWRLERSAPRPLERDRDMTDKDVVDSDVVIIEENETAVDWCVARKPLAVCSRLSIQSAEATRDVVVLMIMVCVIE